MTTSSNNPLKTGDVFNCKCIILEFIDKGSMGEIYIAHQNNHHRCGTGFH